LLQNESEHSEVAAMAQARAVAKRSGWLAGAALLAAVALAASAPGCRREPRVEEPVAWPEIRGYAKMEIPADNPMTREKVELGKQLYYDKRLSGDGQLSCYSCHLEELGLMDGKPKAVGSFGVQLPRRSPTLWNIGYHAEFYWDGRSPSLEAQARAAWTGGNMGVSGQDGRPGPEDIAARFNAIPAYQRQFQAVFGGPATPENLMQAISAFERTIVSTAENSRWIRFREGDESAFSEEEKRGYEIFRGKARCTNCHDGLLVTDLMYHNVGTAWDPREQKLTDEGRFRVTNRERDKGAFKTPTLLDASKRTHFFHNGSVASFEEAVDLMLRGGVPNPWLDRANLEPVVLTPAEREDLLAFLRALDVDYNIRPPRLPE
jgi:cytochrome c peroxidase